MRQLRGAVGAVLAAALAVAAVGCGNGSRPAVEGPPGPHPPALPAAGKASASTLAKTRQARASGKVPLHQSNGAICISGGMITVSAPYVMTSWFVQRPGKLEKVRYQSLLEKWSSGAWRSYKAGTVWGAFANEDGLYQFGKDLGSFYWVSLTPRDPSGKSFSGLAPGYYRAVVKFIWPAANRSVTELAGDHYYWDSGETAEYCTFV